MRRTVNALASVFGGASPSTTTIMKNRELRRYFSDRPSHLSKFEWRTLVRALLTPPDPSRMWVKDKKTGQWNSVAV